MRRLRWRNMIGSLVFYVLFPLSRYLSRLSSRVSNKGLPPVVVNGSAVWDGSVVPTKSFTSASQTTLLDQWLSPNRGAEGGTKVETKERMKEPSPEMEANERPDADEGPLAPGPHKETNGEATTISEDQSADVEREAHVSDQQREDGAEAARRKDGEVTIHGVLHVKQCTAGGNVSPAESSGPEEAPMDSAQGNIRPLQQHIQEQSTEESLAQVTECWDEYEAQIAGDGRDGASSSAVARPPRSFDARAHVDPFPALAEEKQCPPWQFPAGSYYPQVEQNFPFEVPWRVWEELDGSAALATVPVTNSTMTFTVMSYNILAQDLLEANEELYRHSSLQVLEWSFRYTLLVKEIQKWAPDILCLQEVQENHYSEQLFPFFSQMGYTCVYKRRTGTKTDGCATCYRSSHFSMVSLTQLEFFKPETELLDRHNVGIVLLLQPVVARASAVTETVPLLCVANTHLLFNPRRGDIKLAQLAIMLAEIDCMVKSCKVRGQHCNVVLCGDFNSVPHMPLYQLITTGQLYYHGLPAWTISGQEDLSYKTHCHRLFAPLWPSSLGISDNCQYTAVNDMLESPNRASEKCQYRHDFMLRLRYCPAACVHPQDLPLIPGVTDNTPDASGGDQPYNKRHVIRHRLDLESAYEHILPGSGTSEVTTLNSDSAATVDYIFYSPRRLVSSEPDGGDFMSRGLTLTGRLSLLSGDVLWGMNGLPNDTFPSDHLSLLAKFQLDLNAKP